MLGDGFPRDPDAWRSQGTPVGSTRELPAVSLSKKKKREKCGWYDDDCKADGKHDHNQQRGMTGD